MIEGYLEEFGPHSILEDLLNKYRDIHLTEKQLHNLNVTLLNEARNDSQESRNSS